MIAMNRFCTRGITCLCLLMLGVLSACSNQPIAFDGLETGAWIFVSQDGDEVEVAVSELNAGEYYFDAGTHVISGLYVINGQDVVMAKPDNPRMGDITWRRHTATYVVLTREPPVELSGERLLASSMSRSRP